LFYFKPETGVHVTEVMIYRCILFIIFVISCKQSVNNLVAIYLLSVQCYV